jgi:carbamoyl-phosphate synthase large subunit
MSKYWDTTMQTNGNDYIYVNCLEYSKITNPESLSIRLSDRHLGIGGDGVVLIEPSSRADASVSLFNPDGTPGGVCGNALSCVCKYLYDEGVVRKPEMHIEMCGFVLRLHVSTTGSKVSTVTVDMCEAEFLPMGIPVKLDGERLIGRRVSVAGGEYAITCLSLGNPYCVVFCDDVFTLDLGNIGPMFENDPIFPERVNTVFVQVLDGHALLARVWERGNGETQACGTGACAAAIAAVENGHCNAGDEVMVKLPGGDLTIRYTGSRVSMTGSATKCFDGVIEI